jgi:Uma2 family endonuclease
MSAGTLIDVDAYLRTSYRPDREYRDGVIMERNVGDRSHSLLQILLGAYLVRHRDAWQIAPYTELRIRVREGWYPIPDLCVYTLPGPQERVPTVLPLLWIEILSEDDRMAEVWQKAKDLVSFGVPYVWIIEPNTLESQLMTASEGMNQVAGKTLSIPGTPIVIPLIDVMEE